MQIGELEEQLILVTTCRIVGNTNVFRVMTSVGNSKTDENIGKTKIIIRRTRFMMTNRYISITIQISNIIKGARLKQV